MRKVGRVPSESSSPPNSSSFDSNNAEHGIVDIPFQKSVDHFWFALSVALKKFARPDRHRECKITGLETVEGLQDLDANRSTRLRPQFS